MPETLIAFDGLLKQFYSADKIQNIIASEAPFFTRVSKHPTAAPVGQLSAASVVALTTFCALEWLRHRKAEVAAAEQSGDYTTLIEEFAEWLRALFAGWRKALGLEEG